LQHCRRHAHSYGFCVYQKLSLCHSAFPYDLPCPRAPNRKRPDTSRVIRDNGTGIPPEVREKLFNPFFTTKPAGEGTGLGLSISHDIVVKQHAGSIDVETQPGEFTEFKSLHGCI
jgi:two-component system, NtrC family, sensor kinase